LEQPALKERTLMTRVLIADDDTDTRDTLKLVLEDAGYQTLEVPDGRKALEILRRDPQPLVAVLDLAMPRLDGLSILRIAARKSFQRLGRRRTYILLTARTPAAYAPLSALLKQMRVQVLHKPFDIDQLLQIVANAAATLGPTGD
jgi:CheY-like chemotaxis protein